MKQNPEELRDILKKLKRKKVYSDGGLTYFKKEVYPILIKKIEEKYRIEDLKQIKDNLNLNNLNF